MFAKGYVPVSTVCTRCKVIITVAMSGVVGGMYTSVYTTTQYGCFFHYVYDKKNLL